MSLTFTERWLLLSEIPLNELSERSARAWKRAERYPSPINRFYPIIVFMLDRFGPFLILFSFRRASKLSALRFEQFIVRLKMHRSPYIRGMGIMATLPLMEVLENEAPVVPDFVHPLDQLEMTV